MGNAVAVNRHPNSARFHALLAEMGELHDRKQADYGRGDDPFANVRASEEWGVPAWVGAMVRLNDKVRRLQAFALKGSLANESAADSLIDIAVYAVIALVLYEQESAERQETVSEWKEWPPATDAEEAELLRREQAAFAQWAESPTTEPFTVTR